VFETDSIHKLNLLLFEIQTVSGKRKDLVACFNIVKDTCILYKNFLFITSYLLSINQIKSNITTKLKSLSKTQQQQFLSLHNNFSDKHSFSNIVKINALLCSVNFIIDDIYSTICLINHSYLSNAHNSWNSNTKCETIYTIHYINAEKEIIIFYNKNSFFNSQHTYVKDAYSFNYNCSLCFLLLSEL